MQRELVLSLATLAGLGSAGYVALQDRVFVVNLKDPHPIEGTVKVDTPIPHSETQSLMDVIVAPAPRDEPSLWTEAGFLETDGFTSVVLSLHGQFRGSPSGIGDVGLVLIPEEENILRALGEGEVHLPLDAVAVGVPDGLQYFSSSRAGLAIAFPRYRVFLYNTTDRSASVNIFAYVTH
ncbi:MAG TPA: hypothetical protein VJ921_08325 [Vicinamibacteria bacterium]|nr:hypothetical protein [Vicinamibacteria bacterium]